MELFNYHQKAADQLGYVPMPTDQEISSTLIRLDKVLKEAEAAGDIDACRKIDRLYQSLTQFREARQDAKRLGERSLTW